VTALRLWPFATVLALTACGGGDGNGDSSSSTAIQSVRLPAYPFSIASTTLTSTDDGTAMTLQFSARANTGTATFNGVVAETGSLSLTVLEGSTPVVTSISTAYYLPDPYIPLGRTVTANGVSEEVTFSRIYPPPSTLTVGSNGTLDTALYYNAENVNIGAITEQYSVTANDANSVKYTVFANGTVNGAQESDTFVYTISNSGTVDLIEIDLVVNGGWVSFKP
jgi:hypothetical protein